MIPGRTGRTRRAREAWRPLVLGAIAAATAFGGARAGAQPAAPPVQIVEELRLDAVAQDFPSVGRIFVGPRGQIVVPIVQDMQVRVYDANGRRIAAFGRRGSGPGEFRSISLVGWVGDTMWVGDIRERRTSFYGPDFTLLRTTPWTPPRSDGVNGTLAFFDPLALRADGSALGQALLQVAGAGGREARHAVMLWRGADGTVRIVLDAGPQEEAPWIVWYSGVGNMIPFALTPQYSFATDGSRFAQLSAPIPKGGEGTFTVTVFDLPGDTLMSRTFPFRGVPIPARAADSALAAFIPADGRRYHAGPEDAPRRLQALARARMPSVYTPVETILLGLDRTVWIGLRPTAEGRGYLILDGRGDPIGSVRVPISTRVRQASATHLWVTETDDDGLSSVVRYRIEGLSCGSNRC